MGKYIVHIFFYTGIPRGLFCYGKRIVFLTSLVMHILERFFGHLSIEKVENYKDFPSRKDLII